MTAQALRPQRMNAPITVGRCDKCGVIEFVVELKRETDPEPVGTKLCTACLVLRLEGPRHQLGCDALASGETCGLEVRTGDLDCSCGATPDGAA